ncbi:MAG: universal stress protein E [Paraglaciecola sp.]
MRYGAFSNMPAETIDLYIEQARLECPNNLQSLVEEINKLVGKDPVDYLRPKVHLVKGQPSKEIPLMVESMM